MAGKRKGKEDDRHLWPEMLRAIREISPRWVVGENVRGLTNWNGGVVFDEVQADLEAEGYEVLPFLLPACAVNAPHRRDRIWFVAYCNSNGFNQRNSNNEVNTSEGRVNALSNINESNEYGDAADTQYKGLEGQYREWERCSEHRENKRIFIGSKNKFNYRDWQNFPTVSPVRFGDDGLSNRLDTITFSKWRNESIKAGGNAIVPQVVYQIFKAIEEYDRIPDTEQNNKTP
jgi:DNA (cytosine-5)-methyltransferase 1